MIWDGKTREYVETSSVFFTENAEDLQKTSKWTEMERYYKGYAMATDGLKLLVASVGFHVDTGYAGKVHQTLNLHVVLFKYIIIPKKGLRYWSRYKPNNSRDKRASVRRALWC